MTGQPEKHPQEQMPQEAEQSNPSTEESHSAATPTGTTKQVTTDSEPWKAPVAESSGEAAIEKDGPEEQIPLAAAKTVSPAASDENEPFTDSEAAREREEQTANAEILAASRRHTRRSFLGAAAAVAGGFGFYRYLNLAPSENMQPAPLEQAYRFSASVSRTVFREQPLAPTYPLSRAETLRINGIYGLKKDVVLESWRLQVVGVENAAQHARYVPDVTAWEYRYKATPANTDIGHDTKVDPSKDHGAGPVSNAPSNGGPPLASGQAPPSAPPENEQNGGKPTPRGQSKRVSSMFAGKAGPASSLAVAPASQADTDDEEDDNRTGRKARGMEEAGESDSTLPPHTPGLLLQLADITRLPRIELVTQFKCIEGWSQIVHWAGVRMVDFLELYPPALIDGKEPRYVYMETPDGDYYTGYDLLALRHPQTLLVTEMMGAPLTQNHGAPLRLHMPTKYGYKQIKRIGLIAYTYTKPDDYWTKLGYDWYAGL